MLKPRQARGERGQARRLAANPHGTGSRRQLWSQSPTPITDPPLAAQVAGSTAHLAAKTSDSGTPPLTSQSACAQRAKQLANVSVSTCRRDGYSDGRNGWSNAPGHVGHDHPSAEHGAGEGTPGEPGERVAGGSHCSVSKAGCGSPRIEATLVERHSCVGQAGQL